MLIYYKDSIMNLGLLSHLLGLGAPEPTGDGGLKSPTVFLTSFLVLKLAGNLEVPNEKREDVWVCSDHQCPCGEGKMTPSNKGRDRLCLTNYLVISPRELGS